MLAQKELYRHGFSFRVIGMPDSISHDCGVAIFARSEDLPEIVKIFEKIPVTRFAVYKKSADQYYCIYPVNG